MYPVYSVIFDPRKSLALVKHVFKYTMSSLETITSSLVSSAPYGELIRVSHALTTITGDSSSVNDAIETFIKNGGAIFSNTYIASAANRVAGSTKFIDHIHNKKFNVDLKTFNVIDLESADPIEKPPYFNELVDRLSNYGDDHYPSTFAFTLVPEHQDLKIIIIGERKNEDNFFTGRWKSEYLLKPTGSIQGSVSLDIHYFEEGNVRLSFEEKVDAKINPTSAHETVKLINDTENDITLKIVDYFNELNQKSFKNLRRLLPITRSKVNWGKAIGNYRLGLDVVNSS